MDYTLVELDKYSDERGFLIEFLKKSELGGDKPAFGQIYLSTIKPGSVRGNHFHRAKHEFFAPMSGSVSVVLEDVETNERVELTLDSAAEKITRLRVGPKVAHVILNTSSVDVVLCSYTDKEYDSENLDQEVYRVT